MAEEKNLDLVIGRFYSAQELSIIFGFRPAYLRATGGMISVPAKKALLLITHFDVGSSFTYNDRWEAEDLIYTGRGQLGHQHLAGANLLATSNSRLLFLFERVGVDRRRFLGEVTCVEYWWALAPDSQQEMRKVLRMKLRLRKEAANKRLIHEESHYAERRRRNFVLSPPEVIAHSRGVVLTAIEKEQYQEKMGSHHRQVLVYLACALLKGGWASLEEVPVGLDLSAIREGLRIFFEVKVLGSSDDIGAYQSAMGQLLEYRYHYGVHTDKICLVVDVALPEEVLRFYNALGAYVLWYNGSNFISCGIESDRVFASLSD